MTRRVIKLTLEEDEASFLYGVLTALQVKESGYSIYRNLIEKLREELSFYRHIE